MSRRQTPGHRPDVTTNFMRRHTAESSSLLCRKGTRVFNPKLKFFIFSEWHINHSEKIITSVYLGAHSVASSKDRTESDAQAQCIRETQGLWPKGTLGLIQNSESKQTFSPLLAMSRRQTPGPWPKGTLGLTQTSESTKIFSPFLTAEKTDSRSLAQGYLRPHSKAREQKCFSSPLAMSRRQTPGPWR